MSRHAEKPATVLLPPAPYAAALIGGWWIDRNQQPIPLDLGTLARPFAWLLVGIGALLFAWTLWTFWRHRTTANPYLGASRLATDGPFRFTRNPIYLGDWFFLAGLAVLLQTWWPLLFAPLIWLLLRYGVIAHEERHLEARFGAEYLVYKQRVRRWL
jgi:protein-S-isoprenylcysteine O-methyltransferase Ste14